MPAAQPVGVTIKQVAANLDGQGEHCVIDAATFTALGFGADPLTHDFTRPGSRPQIRVVSDDNPNRYALYTVAELASATNPVVEMGPLALERLFGNVIPTNLQAKVDADMQLWVGATNKPGFAENCPSDTGAFLAAIAPHGGKIEEWTDEQVGEVANNSQLANRGIRAWSCEGAGNATIGAKKRWHITSNDVSELSFPCLKDLIGIPFTHAVSFHGFEHMNPNHAVVYVGGGANGKGALKQLMVKEIQKVSQQNLMVTDKPPSKYAGDEEDNIVNRLARGNGIQIEQSVPARTAWHAQIAQAVASVYESLPDVYVRDNVNDTGAPHNGPLSLSPDVIVKQAPVNAQGLYGKGSGTENDVTLSDEVEQGQEHYLYVRVMNRGKEEAQQVTAEVFWSEVATLVTPNMWNFIGRATNFNVKSGDTTVAGPIKFSPPAAGHYCFVALIGNELDPVPDHTAIQDWDEFTAFVRYRNNATWRNFNVVNLKPDMPPPPGLPKGFVELRFLAPGAPDRDRPMRLELGGELPGGAELLLDVPLEMLGWMERRPEISEVDEERRTARLRIDLHRGQELGEVEFRARSRSELRLLARIPDEFWKDEHELFARQLYDDVEVGRVTWRLTARDRDAESGLPRWRRDWRQRWPLLGTCAIGLIAAIGLWLRRKRPGWYS